MKTTLALLLAIAMYAVALPPGAKDGNAPPTQAQARPSATSCLDSIPARPPAPLSR
jgi:hypothetical protein